MHSLVPFSPDPSYLSVFTENIDSPTVAISTIAIGVVLASFVLCIVIASLNLAEKGWGRWVWRTGIVFIIAGVITLFLASITNAITDNNKTPASQAQVDHMNANLQQKYKATLFEPDTGKYKDEDLVSGVDSYILSFPDGRKGLYNIKWDKDTSEPTVIEKPAPPTTQELNRAASKPHKQ